MFHFSIPWNKGVVKWGLEMKSWLAMGNNIWRNVAKWETVLNTEVFYLKMFLWLFLNPISQNLTE